MSISKDDSRSQASDQETWEQNQPALAQTQVLLHIAHTLITSPNLPALLQIVANTLADVLPANQVRLTTFDLQKQQVTHCVNSGPGGETAAEVAFDELWTGLSGLALRELKPVLASKTTLDTGRQPETQCLHAKTEAGAMMVVPLCYQDKVLGTLTACNPVECPDFTSQQVELMAAVANQCALAVENAHLNQELQSIATGSKPRINEQTAELADANARLQTEIVERDQIIQALQNSENRYRLLIENLNDSLAVIDDHLNLTYANRRFCDLLSYPYKELIGQPLKSFLSAASQEVLDRHIIKRRRGEMSAYELEWITKAGRRIATQVSGSPLLDDQGEFQGSYAVITDITEQKRTEAALRQSEQRKTILNQIAHIFLTIPDEEMYGEVLSVILQATKSRLGLYGFIDTEGNLVIPSMTRGVWGECQVPSKSIVFPPGVWGNSLWGRALREKKLFAADGPFHTPEGHIPIEHFLTVPITFGDETIGVISIANGDRSYSEEDKHLLEDITNYISPILKARLQRDWQEQEREKTERSLQASEQKYRTLFEESFDGLFITSPSGKILDMNKKGIMMFGYDTKAELLALDLEKDVYAYPPDRKRILAMVKARGTAEYEVVVKKKSGEQMVTYCALTAVKDETGAITTYRGIIRDITESKRIQSIMQARLRLLEFARSHSTDELLTATLDEIEALTGSTIGFYHFLEADQKTLSLQNWSTNTLKNMCTAEGKGSDYDVAQAGVWVDCVRERRPVIHNDYAALPHRQGMPAGHALVIREVVVPIFRGNQIAAIIGVGNKSTPYNEGDIEIVSQLGDLSWDITERKQGEEALKKQYSTLRSIIDSANTPIFSVDRQYRYTSFNQNHAAVMKAIYGAEIAVGHSMPGYMTVVEDREVAKRNLDRALAGEQLVEESFSGEELRSRRYFQVSHSPVKSETGEIIGVVVLVQDMTAPKRAEEEHLAHLRFLECMDQVNRAIQGTNDLEQMMSDVLDLLLSSFACDRSWLVYPCDPEASSLQVLMERTRPEYPGALALRVDIPMSPDNAGNLQKLLAAPGPLSFGPGADLPVPEAVMTHFGVQSFIAMALYPKTDKPWQLGLHQCSYPRVWSLEEKRLFQEIGRRLSDALTSLLAYRDLRENERELRQSNNLLRTIIECAPIAIIGLDLDGNVQLVWNPAAEKMLGWSAPEVMGRLLPSVPADSQEQYRGFLDRIRRGEGLDGVEVRRQRRDGSPIDYSIYASPLYDAEGKLIGNIAILVDITESKQAEEALRRYNQRLSMLHELDRRILVATSVEAIAEIVLEHLAQLIPCEFTSINLYNETITEERIFALRRTPNISVHTETIMPTVENQSHEGVKSGQAAVTADLNRETGPLPPLAQDLIAQGLHAAMAQPLIAQGHLIGVLDFAALSVGFFTPEHQQIAEEVGRQMAIAFQQAGLNARIARYNTELEQRVRERTRQLEHANRELELFSYSVSHDLRAPLRAIQGFAEIIGRRHRDSLNEEGRHYFDNIITASEQMNQLITDLLNYSRLGRQRVQLAVIPLAMVLSEAMETLALPIKETAAQIHIAATLPEVQGDRTLLKQIFTNLLENALIYHRPGLAPRIDISYMFESGSAIIRVTDNGIGIPAEFHEKIFDIFQRLHNQDEYPGTGIGLAIVRKSVEMLNGDVWVETPAAGGSVFCVRLPFDQAEKEA